MIFSRRWKSSMSVGPRAPAFRESSVWDRRWPWAVVRYSLSCAGTLLVRGVSTGTAGGGSTGCGGRRVPPVLLLVERFCAAIVTPGVVMRESRRLLAHGFPSPNVTCWPTEHAAGIGLCQHFRGNV